MNANNGFKIAGIGAAGILIEPQLQLSWALSGGLDMSYGFELNVSAIHTMTTASVLRFVPGPKLTDKA